MKRVLLTVLFLSAVVAAQVPVPQPPRVYIDTTWNLPTGGMTWSPHTSTDFQNALNSSHPGDVIVLDAGRVYSGNFTLPAKANPAKLWIYIVSSKLVNLPPTGTRVSPNRDAVNMPKIVTPNVNPAVNPAYGSNHYRLVGLEIYSLSNQGCVPNNVPPINCYSYFLFAQPDGGFASPPAVLPDSITLDRVYMHGSNTQDIQAAVAGNVTNLAVIDSYISDIHHSTFDSQAVMAYYTPGPIKIVNNELQATTENVIFGGGGQHNGQNPYVPSDIEIRKNHLFKPLAWNQVGVTVPPHNQWTVKNNLEFKSARRAVVTGNVMENTWVSGQVGASLLFTIRTSQSGNGAVVDDVDVENNIFKNVDMGMQTLEQDNLCGAAYGYPYCTNPGESRRIRVANNLFLLSTNSDTYQHYWVSIDGGNATHPGLVDYVFQHNTVLMQDQSKCWNSIYFKANQGESWPPPQSYTTNVWFLDNVLCRQPSGDWAGQGTAGLTNYMGNPAPLASRYLGNVMFVPTGDRVQTFPVHNYATMVPFAYISPAMEDFQLSSPLWNDTSDGKEAGINWSVIYGALSPLDRPGTGSVAGMFSGLPNRAP